MHNSASGCASAKLFRKGELAAHAKRERWEVVEEFYDADVSGADPIETRPDFFSPAGSDREQWRENRPRRGCVTVRTAADRPGDRHILMMEPDGLVRLLWLEGRQFSKRECTSLVISCRWDMRDGFGWAGTRKSKLSGAPLALSEYFETTLQASARFRSSEKHMQLARWGRPFAFADLGRRQMEAMENWAA